MKSTKKNTYCQSMKRSYEQTSICIEEVIASVDQVHGIELYLARHRPINDSGAELGDGLNADYDNRLQFIGCMVANALLDRCRTSKAW